MRYLLLLALAGCATTGTVAVPSETKVPVAVSCIKDAPVKPAASDEKAIMAMDDYAATLTTWTERLELKAYAEKADAAIQACK